MWSSGHANNEQFNIVEKYDWSSQILGNEKTTFDNLENDLIIDWC
jgi:hypothetical protein